MDTRTWTHAARRQGTHENGEPTREQRGTREQRRSTHHTHLPPHRCRPTPCCVLHSQSNVTKASNRQPRCDTSKHRLSHYRQPSSDDKKAPAHTSHKGNSWIGFFPKFPLLDHAFVDTKAFLSTHLYKTKMTCSTNLQNFSATVRDGGN